MGELFQPKTAPMKNKSQLAVVYWPTEKLKPYLRNPRKNDGAVDRMCQSIKEFGFTIPVLVRKSGEVIDGHLRLKAAIKLAVPEVPVIICDGWTEAQVKAFRLLANRSVTWADWDTEALAAEFLDLKAMEFDLSLTGFDSREIASLHTAEVMESLIGAVFEPRAQIIWRKQQALFSRGAYHWQHEPCWYAVRKGRPSHWVGDRKQSTVWDIQNLNPTGNRDEERVGHSAQKPVEIMRRPILNHTKAGDEVYDPFLGSGTTIIAAESTERICYGLELSPAYCDVIVTRWQNLTGKLATLEAR